MQTGVTPSSNTAPNISGTAYTTSTNGDLILTCVYVEQNPLATQILLRLLHGLLVSRG